MPCSWLHPAPLQRVHVGLRASGGNGIPPKRGRVGLGGSFVPRFPLWNRGPQKPLPCHTDVGWSSASPALPAPRPCAHRQREEADCCRKEPLGKAKTNAAGGALQQELPCWGALQRCSAMKPRLPEPTPGAPHRIAAPEHHPHPTSPPASAAGGGGGPARELTADFLQHGLRQPWGTSPEWVPYRRGHPTPGQHGLTVREAVHKCLERGITQPPRATCGSRACNFALPQTQWRGERAAAKTRGESRS